MCIGRASPHAGVEEADSIMTSRQLRKNKPFATPGIGRRTPTDPRRRTTPEPRRRPPDPRDVLQGRAPGGEERSPRALQGFRTNTLRIRGAGTPGRGAEGRPKTASRCEAAGR
jgi:hypothetical protein